MDFVVPVIPTGQRDCCQLLLYFIAAEFGKPVNDVGMGCEGEVMDD